MAHLSDLKRLQDGWAGPGSKAIPTHVFASYATLQAAFDSRIPGDLKPTASSEGGIAMEWGQPNGHYFFADINPDGSMYLCHLRPDELDDTDCDYPEFDAAVLKHFYYTGEIRSDEEGGIR